MAATDDPAVQIVAEVLRQNAASVYEMDEQIVAALREAGELGRPGELAALRDMIDAAHGLICNAHQKRVDDVTTDDGASPGWAEAARRWIDAYPPVAAPPALDAADPEKSDIAPPRSTLPPRFCP